MSLRRYFSFVILFVVLFSFVAIVTMDFNVSSASYDTSLQPEEILPLPVTEVSKAAVSSTKAYYVVGPKDDTHSTVLKTLRYIRKPYLTADSLAAIAPGTDYAAIIVTQNRFSGNEIGMLSKLLENGIPVIFAKMPDQWALSGSTLQSMLGIDQIGAKSEQKGFLMIDGFLLGGRMTYEDVTTTANQVSLDSLCKIYVRANSPVLTDENGGQSALLWRTFYHNTPIFVFNNTFLEGNAGIGPLVSVLSLLEDVFVYPIISSFSVSLTDFPLDNNFDHQAMQIFDRDTQGTLRDILFPEFILLSSQSGIQFSFFSPKDGMMSEFWSKEIDKYRYALFEDMFAIHSDLVTTTGFGIDKPSELLSRSFITALGLVNHAASVEDTFRTIPGNDWRVLSKGFSAELFTLSERFAWIDKYNYDQAATAINSYLFLKPQITVSETKIDIHCEGFRERGVFLVRLRGDKQLTGTNGATILEIEPGVFKVTLTVPDASLEIKAGN